MEKALVLWRIVEQVYFRKLPLQRLHVFSYRAFLSPRLLNFQRSSSFNIYEKLNSPKVTFDFFSIER